MQRYPKKLLININHDYKVVINIHKVIIKHNVKLNSTFKEMIRAHLTLVNFFHTIPQWASVGGLYTIPSYIY
jgi:hypothetical protein